MLKLAGQRVGWQLRRERFPGKGSNGYKRRRQEKGWYLRGNSNPHKQVLKGSRERREAGSRILCTTVRSRGLVSIAMGSLC